MMQYYPNIFSPSNADNYNMTTKGGLSSGFFFSTEDRMALKVHLLIIVQVKAHGLDTIHSRGAKIREEEEKKPNL